MLHLITRYYSWKEIVHNFCLRSDGYLCENSFYHSQSIRILLKFDNAFMSRDDIFFSGFTFGTGYGKAFYTVED